MMHFSSLSSQAQIRCFNRNVKESRCFQKQMYSFKRLRVSPSSSCSRCTVKGIYYYKTGRFFLIHLVFFTEWLMGRKTPKPGEDQHLNNPGGKVAQKAFKLPYQ